jgi:Transposase IS66 family
MSPPDELVSAHPEEIESLLERVRRNQLGEQDLRLLERLLRLLLSVVRFVERKNASLAHLKRLLFGPPSDPPSSAPPASPISAEPSDAPLAPATTPEQDSQRRGHGRLPGSAYTGATPVRCLHPQLHPGACCPDPGCSGRLFDTTAPAIFIRLTGQPLVGATRYEQQVLRCSACQQRYTAPLPEGVPAEKCDATADVAIVMAKYAAGLPFHRLAQMQQASGIPLPESVQWERCEAVADALLPVYLHLRTLASEAEVLIGDDTGVQILSCCQENQQRTAGERHGLHTTGIVAQGSERPRVDLGRGAANTAKSLFRHRPTISAPWHPCCGRRTTCPRTDPAATGLDRVPPERQCPFGNRRVRPRAEFATAAPTAACAYERKKAVHSASAWVHWEAGIDQCKRLPSVRSHTRRILASSVVIGSAGADTRKSAGGKGTKAGGGSGFAFSASRKRARRAPALKCNSWHSCEAE